MSKPDNPDLDLKLSVKAEDKLIKNLQNALSDSQINGEKITAKIKRNKNKLEITIKTKNIKLLRAVFNNYLDFINSAMEIDQL